jgi:acyl carrier protein
VTDMIETIEDQVHRVVADVLKIASDLVTSELAIGDVPEWDSIANIRLLQTLEETFDIEIDALDALEAEDVYDFVQLVKTYKS